jgi:ABC-type uncharacterized transport system permease subunit
VSETVKTSYTEKLLGKNYKWWYVVRYYLRLQTAYRSDLLLYNLAGFLDFSVTILIWFLVTRVDNSLIEANNILTYLFIGYAYNSLSFTWYSEHLTRDIQNGTLANQLITPSSIFWRGFFQFVGQGILAGSFFKFFPLLLALPFIWSYLVWPTDPLIWLSLLLFIPIMFFIKQATEFIVGSLAFWTVSAGGLLEINGVIMSFLTGRRIPLDLIWTGLIFQPLAFGAYHGMKIFLGEYSFLGIFTAFGGGLLWCLILYLIGQIIFKMGLKKNESVGL